MSDLEQTLSKIQPQTNDTLQGHRSPHNQQIQTRQANDHKKRVNAVNEVYKRKQEQYTRLGSMRTDFIHAIEQDVEIEILLILALDMLEITTDKAFITTAKNKLKGKL